MNLVSDIGEVKGVGSVTAEHLRSLNINTIGDLFEYFPRKYDDYSNATAIINLQPGLVTLRCSFINVSSRQVRRGIHITEASAIDESGAVKVVWFNQPYRAKAIKPGQAYMLTGEFGLKSQRLQIVNPSIEQYTEKQELKSSKIIATYKESKNISSQVIRKIINQCSGVFTDMPESLPDWVLNKYNLLSRSDAYKNIHMPKSKELLESAKQRLAFEELLIVMLAAKKNRDIAQLNKAQAINFNEKLAKDFVANLPFKLTDAQRKTVWQIYKNMQSDRPMNRLLEGDVGSGKTVVAAMAALMVLNADMQVALIAPTELLARQHADTLFELFKGTKYGSKLALLVGATKLSSKKDIKKRLKNHEIRFLIGTHSLLQQDVDWHDLGLIIIDEQHRFGVEQRHKLLTKTNKMPHILLLTATPIPRSLALTVYGELDISILDQAPSTRAGVKSTLVSPNSLKQMYLEIEEQLAKGRQAYIVCPLITESDLLQVASAEETYKKLKNGELKNWRIGLLHGKLKPAQKEQVMADFKNKKYDVLVSTTVIEVGVDVPNASVMVILGANRFGLAQLHQLRGRVGRGEHLGHCYMVLSDSQAPSKRMRSIVNINNGFELSEIDLEIRGPGAIYGYRQHGALDLRLAKLTDVKLIALVRNCINNAENQGKDMLKYKQIADKVRRVSRLTYLN